MAVTANERLSIQKLGIALFNCALGATYLQEFSTYYEANGRSLSGLALTLSGTPAYKALNPVNQTAAEFAKVVLTPYQLQDEPEAVAYVAAKFNAFENKGLIAYEVAAAIDAYAGDYPALVKARAIFINKTTVADYFTVVTSHPDTDFATLQRVIATVSDTQASIVAATLAIDNNVGVTLMLTAQTETLLGTSANDTFESNALTLNPADKLNGAGGYDTLKISAPTVANLAALPQLTSIEKISLTTAAAGGVLDISTLSGVTAAESEDQTQNLTIKVGSGQTVTLIGTSLSTGTTTVSGNTPAAVSLTLNGFGKPIVGSTNTVDLSGTGMATLNVTATGSSKVIVTNTGAALKTVTVGDTGSANLVPNAAVASAVTTVDASTNTAANTGVTWDASAVAVAPTFTFKGGSGNDTLSLAAGNLATILVGSQLNGGAGTGDKLNTADVTANFTAGGYAKINATTGFEVLGLAGAGATSIDASKLSSIKQFSIESDQIHFIDGMGVGGKVYVSGAVTNHTNDITLYCLFGVDDLGLTLGDAQSGGITVGGNFTVGQRFVALASNGTGASANVLNKLLNSDDSIYTITGSNDLTISATQARVIGSKFDGSAATGKLNFTSNTAAFSSGSARGDTIIGGSAADTLKAGLNSTLLTGNGGSDKFDVSTAVAGAAAAAGPNITTVADFTRGDIISFAAKGAEAFNAAKVDVTGATTLAAALDLAAAGNGSTNGILRWFQFGGNTYLVEDMTNGNFASTDIVVKLSGVIDLSAALYNPAAHTLAMLF